MLPFEAESYADGWRACLADTCRDANPYRPPFASALDPYRRVAWNRGWDHCFLQKTNRPHASGQED